MVLNSPKRTACPQVVSCEMVKLKVFQPLQCIVLVVNCMHAQHHSKNEYCYVIVIDQVAKVVGMLIVLTCTHC